MKYDLEERLTNFSVQIIALIESMPSTKAANHLAGQLLRSGTSPALNYAEAQSGESRNDFIHKNKNCSQRTEGIAGMLKDYSQSEALQIGGRAYGTNQRNKRVSFDFREEHENGRK